MGMLSNQQGDVYKVVQLRGDDRNAGVVVGQEFKILRGCAGGMYVDWNGVERYMCDDQMQLISTCDIRPTAVVHDEYSGFGLMARLRSKRAARQ